MVTDRFDRLDGVTEDRSRGQLLLIGAVAIALLIFGLAIVLNSVLYTSTVSPQAASDGTANAEMYRDAVERDVGGLMRSLANGSDYVAEDRFRSNLTDYEARLAESAAASGPGTVSIEYDSGGSVTGARVRQTSQADFDSASGAEDWVVADRVSSLDSFNITVEKLPQTTSGKSREFQIRAEETSGSDIWQLNVYYDKTMGSGEVVFESFDGVSTSTICAFSASNRNAVTLDIDLPAGTVDGRPACSFNFAQGVSGDYRLEFERIGPGGSDDTEGTYEGVIQGSVPASNFNSPTTDPYLERTIYNATVDVTYVSDAISYETTVENIGPRPAATAPNTAPSASFTVSENEPAAGQSVTFDASGSSDADGSISQYQWDFDGDGSYEATGQTVTHTFDTVGDFRPELRVTDDDGTSALEDAEVDPYGAVNMMGGAVSYAVGGTTYEYVGSGSSPPWFTEYGGADTSNEDNVAFGGSGEDSPYETFRYYTNPADPTLEMDVEDGTYEVTLQFAELAFNSDDQREFDIFIEGTQVEDDFDIHEVSGGFQQKYTVTTTVTVTDGELDINFENEINNAALNGIVVESTS
jgi:hypothetical protein